MKAKKRIISMLLVVLMMSAIVITGYGVDTDESTAGEETSTEGEAETDAPPLGDASGAEEITTGTTDQEPGSDAVNNQEETETEAEAADTAEGILDPAPAEDTPAPPETLSDMEASIPVNLTGNYAEDLVRIAYSQLGYAAREDGYCRYAEWCARYAVDWCCTCGAPWNQGVLWTSWRDSWADVGNEPSDAAFASFCLFYAGVPIEKIPPAPTAEYWVWLLSNTANELATATSYTPVPGDLVFFDWDEGNDEIKYNQFGGLQATIPAADHVGIVTETLDDGQIRYIIGDGLVREQGTWTSDETIVGYAVISNPATMPVVEPESENGTVGGATSESETDTETVLGRSAESETAEKASSDERNAETELAVDAEELTTDGVGETTNVPKMIVDSYALAPDGYVLLRIYDDLSGSQCYIFNGTRMLFTTDPLFTVNSMDAGGFVALVPEEYVEAGTLNEKGLALLETVDAERPELMFSADVNTDGVVNIADANAAYQMIQNGGNYYSIEDISLEARISLLYMTIDDYDRVIAAING